MTLMKSKLGALGTLALIAGCAQQPASISAVSVGDVYSDIPCSKAAKLYAEEAAKVPALVSQQKAAAAGDAVGVFLVLVPVSSLTGNDHEGEIAATKGKLLALETRLRACGKTVQPVSWH